MASKKGKHISGDYVVSINDMVFHTCTLNSKKLEGRTKSYFICVFKFNGHPTRQFGVVLHLLY